MSSPVNPYTPPKVTSTVNTALQNDLPSYYVEGDFLVVKDGVDLPSRCILTNDNVTEGKRRQVKIYWSSPALLLLLVVSPVIYLIVYYCVRKGCTLQYSISAPQLRRKRLFTLGWFLTGLITMIGSITLIITASDSNTALGMGILGIIGCIVAFLVAGYFGSAFKIKKHTNGWFHLKGPCKEYLEVIKEAS